MAETPALDGRFGIVIDGIGLLLESGRHAEYLPEVKVYPIPKVSRRLRGAAQVRGQPILVFSAAAQAPANQSVIQTCPVVLLGGPQGGLALQVYEPPQLLMPVEAASSTDAMGDSPADRCFADALGQCYRARIAGIDESVEPQGRLWWEADFSRLFQRLAND